MTLSVICDQFGAPTGAELLADCTAHAIITAQARPEVAGLYHLVASGVTTWADYAELVFAQARKAGIELAVKDVRKISTSEYLTPACRLETPSFNGKISDDFQSAVTTMAGWCEADVG